MDEYYEENLDYELTDMREDYEYIWDKNIVECDLIREENPQAGEYFSEDESEIKIKRKIWLNVQGVSSNDYKRVLAGVITPDATLHAYAKWNDDIEDLDVISFGKWNYRITGFNKSRYDGQVVFQEFDMKRIDHSGGSEPGGGC